LATQAGNRDEMLKEHSYLAFRQLVSYQILVWHTDFFGERRVAISAIPSHTMDAPTIVRELRPSGGSHREKLEVDPHFDLYEGIESGKPQLVPLEVRLFEQADAESVSQYRKETNDLFMDLFRSKQPSSEIVVG